MLDIKDTYSLMFTDYPDIVNFVQMKQMLGGISDTLAYRMLREKKIKSKKVGREYKIPKVNVINYITTD
jgi:excisionase family DNA binding protein